MKVRYILSIGLLLALAACNKAGSVTVTSHLIVRAPDATKEAQLEDTVQRVMERRFAGAQIVGGHATVMTQGSGSALLTLKMENTADADKARQILETPFSFDLRIEKPNADSTQPSDWTPTALTGSSLEWVQAVGNSKTGEVAIELQFTPAGRQILESIFEDNLNKHLGIFVRDLLVSKLTITSAIVSDKVIISGIPSSKVAEIFADDVNVGLRVDYTDIR